MKYKIKAEYTSQRTLIVEGEKGADMTDPSNWGEIVSESENDVWLDDVKSVEEAKFWLETHG